jgi:hypothetical protein
MKPTVFSRGLIVSGVFALGLGTVLPMHATVREGAAGRQRGAPPPQTTPASGTPAAQIRAGCATQEKAVVAEAKARAGTAPTAKELADWNEMVENNVAETLTTSKQDLEDAVAEMAAALAAGRDDAGFSPSTGAWSLCIARARLRQLGGGVVATPLADAITQLREACATEEKILLAVPESIVAAMEQRAGMGALNSTQLAAGALEGTARMHKATVAEERKDLEDDRRTSIDNARKFPAEAPFWNWNLCIDAARVAQLQAGIAITRPPDDPIASGGGGATAEPPRATPGPQPLPPNGAPADASAVATATFANIQKLLEAEGSRLNLGAAFRPLNSGLESAAVVTDGLTKAEKLEVHIDAISNPAGTVRLRVYPLYRGTYVNVSHAEDQAALMRVLLGPARISGPCVYSWKIDKDGDIYDTCILTSDNFPYASIVTALKDIRHVDRIFGEWRSLLKIGLEAK